MQRGCLWHHIIGVLSRPLLLWGTQCSWFDALVLQDYLLALGWAHSCPKGYSCLCSWIGQHGVGPCWICNDHRVLFLGDDAHEVAVSLALVKWVDFRMVNTPPNLILRVLMDLGVITPVIFVIVSFWAMSISYDLFFDNINDISSSSLVLEMGVVWCCFQHHQEVMACEH